MEVKKLKYLLLCNILGILLFRQLVSDRISWLFGLK